MLSLTRSHPARLQPVLRAIALLAALAACTQSEGERAATGVFRLLNSQRNPALETLENAAELTVVPPSRALVHAPEALLVLERPLGAAVEQRLILPNRSAVRGDNVLHVRAQSDITARPSELSLAEITARLGGLPAPFERAGAGALMSGSDSLGSFVFARENIGVDTICVLVLRRIGPNARPLPRGVHALDIILRNCTTGGLDEALAPARDRALAQAAAPQGTVLTLSPFAAPRR